MKLIEKLAAHEAQNDDPDFKDFMENISGVHFESLRKTLGLTQEIVAKHLGINRSRIIAMESLAEPIIPGMHIYYFGMMQKRMEPWGLAKAKGSFSFIDSVDIFSEWVSSRKPMVRYYIAQTTTELVDEDEAHVEFDVFCSDGEDSESTGLNPQSVADAEDILTSKGFVKVENFIELSQEERDGEREGAAMDVFAIINRAFESIAAKKA